MDFEIVEILVIVDKEMPLIPNSFIKFLGIVDFFVNNLLLTDESTISRFHCIFNDMRKT